MAKKAKSQQSQQSQAAQSQAALSQAAQSQQSQNLQLNNVETRRLIDDKVRTMILRGKPRTECLKFILSESKRLGTPHTPLHCSNIYNQVKRDLKDELNLAPDELAADLISKLYYLYEKNIENERWSESRLCLGDIAKMMGLSGGNSVQINKPDETVTITFA